MTNERRTAFSDKAGPCRGCIKDGFITIWRKDMAKEEFSFSVSVGEIEARLRLFYNSNWVFFEIASEGLCKANDAWIANTFDDVLRQKRKDRWENDDICGKYSCAQTRTVESTSRVLRTLFEYRGSK